MRVPVRVLLTAAVAAVLLFLVWTAPPAPIALPGPAVPALRGAFHIHTTRSDGALARDDVAAAAARAGLQFAIFADHGDGTREPDPPEYVHGVLCIDGVEISTNDGHYVAVGTSAAPYPLGGDGAAVVEDVARLGGFGVAAHPGSPRAELAWHDWTVPLDGLEWLNADSEWRDEGRVRLARTLMDYLWRPAGALAGVFDRPVDALDRWDALTASRRVVGLAGHDAHGGLGEEADGAPGRRLHVPSYDATFRTFSLYVTTEALTGKDAVADSAVLIDALRNGQVFTAIDALASPASLEFTATAGGRTVRTGGNLPPDEGAARFTVTAPGPPGAVTRLLRNGRPVAESRGGVLEHESDVPGAYRVEIDVPGAPGSPPVPWLVSNPIYRLDESAQPEPPLDTSRIHPIDLPGGQWRAEVSPDSSGLVLGTGTGVGLWYQLRPGADASQFAALVTDVQNVPPDTTHILLRGRAERPMRVSVQLRFSEIAGGRWRRSVYLDRTEREVLIPIAELRAADGPGPRPAVSGATSLLFVVDLTNGRPGDEGSFALTRAGFRRAPS